MLKHKLLKGSWSSIQWFMLLFFMLTPTLAWFKLWPIPSALSLASTILFVGIFFATVLLSNSEKLIRFNAAFFCFLGLIAVLTISVLSNTYSYEASWRWYLIILILSIMVVVAATELKSINPQRFHDELASLLWVGCLVYGVASLFKYYGIVSQLFTFIEPSEGRLSGILAQSNLTTTICWLGILAATTTFSRRSGMIWMLGSVLLFGWVLACAASRMSWLMGFGLLALVGLSRLPVFEGTGARRIGRWMACAVLSVFVLLIVVPPINQLMIDGLVSLGFLEQGASVSLADREVFNQGARLTELSKLLSLPDVFTWRQWLFGVGPGNYPSFSYQADTSITPDSISAGTWLHSHNIFTMIFVEFGLAGLVTLGAFLVYIIKVMLQKPMGSPQFFSIGGLGILFIHSNLEFPLWHFWFLVLLCLLLTNLFDIKEVRVDSKWMKPALGFLGAALVLALLVNLGSQYIRIAEVALSSNRDRQDFQNLSVLANDSLMGPYSILRKYRDFAPEEGNFEWQMREVQRMKSWQPRDLVVLREFSLLILMEDYDAACAVAKTIAYRYPHSSPVMLEHSILAQRLSTSEFSRIARCIERGLAPRGESIQSIQEKNQEQLTN